MILDLLTLTICEISLPSAAFAFSCSWLALLLSPAGDPHAEPADAAPGAAPQPDPPPPPAAPPGPDPEGGGPQPEVPLDMVSAMPPRRPRPAAWPQPRPRPRRSVRRREVVEEEEAIIGRAIIEVVERGEMTRVEVLLVLMLEDIFVLEVAMRRLAWDCNESPFITQC